MKRILIGGLFLIVSVLTSQAQGVYSQRNLEHASLDSLTYFLNKAKNHRTTGIVMASLSTVALVVGSEMMYKNSVETESFDKESVTNLASGTLWYAVGVGGTIVGLQMIVKNSIRVHMVNIAINNHSKVSLNITPSLVYYDKTQNFSTGIILSVRF